MTALGRTTGQSSEPSGNEQGTPCPRCNGTGVLYPDKATGVADECWAANKPDRYLGAIRDFRIRTDNAYSLRECKNYIDAAKERNP